MNGPIRTILYKDQRWNTSMLGAGVVSSSSEDDTTTEGGGGVSGSESDSDEYTGMMMWCCCFYFIFVINIIKLISKVFPAGPKILKFRLLKSQQPFLVTIFGTDNDFTVPIPIYGTDTDLR